MNDPLLNRLVRIKSAEVPSLIGRVGLVSRVAPNGDILVEFPGSQVLYRFLRPEVEEHRP